MSLLWQPPPPSRRFIPHGDLYRPIEIPARIRPSRAPWWLLIPLGALAFLAGQGLSRMIDFCIAAVMLAWRP